MSAPNFCLRNASRYFVCPEIEDEYEFDMIKEDLLAVAEEKGFQHIDYKFFTMEVENASNSPQESYYATALPCEFERSFKDRFGYYWTVYIVPLIRSGYYQGAVLDFYIKITNAYTLDSENMDAMKTECIRDTIKRYLEDVEYNDEETIREDDEDAIFNALADVHREARAKFYEFCEATGYDEYACGGIFSNGEAVYTNLSEIKRRAQKKGE